MPIDFYRDMLFVLIYRRATCQRVALNDERHVLNQESGTNLVTRIFPFLVSATKLVSDDRFGPKVLQLGVSITGTAHRERHLVLASLNRFIMM